MVFCEFLERTNILACDLGRDYRIKAFWGYCIVWEENEDMT